MEPLNSPSPKWFHHPLVSFADGGSDDDSHREDGGVPTTMLSMGQTYCFSWSSQLLYEEGIIVACFYRGTNWGFGGNRLPRRGQGTAVWSWPLCHKLRNWVYVVSCLILNSTYVFSLFSWSAFLGIYQVYYLFKEPTVSFKILWYNFFLL